MKKLSFLVLWGILGLTLPTSAQHNLEAARKALAAKNSIQQALIKEITGATKPAMYIFPMREALPATGNGTPIGSSIPDRVDLIPGSTFRPYSPLKIVTFRGITFKSGGVTYSGTIFKDENDIFGIIPTHTLRWKADTSSGTLLSELSLPKKFNLEVYDKYGRAIPLQGEIVQIGAMLDVSLVKFHTKDEKLLSPLSLRTKEITAATRLHIQGFNNYEPLLIHFAGLSVFRTTPTFMQVQLPGSINQHAGLCGSPALDEEGRLAGIFVGSRSSESPHELGTGYLTPLSSINTLLEAYRNGGKATFPLQLNGQTVAHVGSDEWVKRVHLFGRDGIVVWDSGPMKKFSYSRVEEKIKELSAAYIGLDIFQIRWSASGELVGKPFKRVVYNLLEQRPEGEGLYKE